MVDEQLPEQNQLAVESKQARREKRRAKEKAKMSQHGKSLARVYKDALTKRAKAKKIHERPS